MKHGFFILLLFTLLGCDMPEREKQFSGAITTHREGGRPTLVTVRLPEGQTDITLRNRQETTALIDELQVLLSDLQEVRDQMTIDENKPLPKPSHTRLQIDRHAE